MFKEKECLAFREAIEKKHEVDLLSKSRKTEQSALKSAFIAAAMRELKPTTIGLARVMGINHATVIHHHRNHKYNYCDMETDYNKLYVFWYNRFEADAKNYEEVVAEYEGVSV